MDGEECCVIPDRASAVGSSFGVASWLVEKHGLPSPREAREDKWLAPTVTSWEVINENCGELINAKQSISISIECGAAWTDFYGEGGAGCAQPAYRGNCNAEDEDQTVDADCPKFWWSGFTDASSGLQSLSPCQDTDLTTTGHSPKTPFNGYCDFYGDDHASRVHLVSNDDAKVSDPESDFYVTGSGATSVVLRGACDEVEVEVATEEPTEAAPEPSPERWPEAWEVAARSLAADEADIDLATHPVTENVWKQAHALWPIMSFAVLPESAPPVGMVEALETCKASLLLRPESRSLIDIERLVALLDSPVSEALLRYLDELEAVVEEATANPAIRWESPAFDAKFLASNVGNALSAWSCAHASLRSCSVALWSALMTSGPTHQRQYLELARVMEARKTIQKDQEEGCFRIAQDLEKAVDEFKSQMQTSVHQDHMAALSQAFLIGIQELSATALERQQHSVMESLQECEALEAKSKACRAVVCEAQIQVQRHADQLTDQVSCFLDSAQHIVAWKSTLVPQLRLLDAYRLELKMMAQLRRQLTSLEEQHVDAEDDFDLVQTKLRKHKRHAIIAKPPCCPGGADGECDYEHCLSQAGFRVQSISEEMQQVKKRLAELGTTVPVAIDFQEAEGCRCTELDDDAISAEGQLALQVAKLEQTNRDMALRFSEAEMQREMVLKQLDMLRGRPCIEALIEAESMCPILHERMQEPVLAADGHTYERGAIERWMSTSFTSPMTGAPLSHRYLTQNYALNRIIASFEAHREDSEGSDRAASAGASTASAVDREMDGDNEDDCEFFARSRK